MEIGCIVNKMKTQSEKNWETFTFKIQIWSNVHFNYAVITFLLCTLECTDMPLTGFDNNIW